MEHARRTLDGLVRAVHEDGFVAHAVHVLVGDDEAAHHWSEDVPRDVHSVAKGVCVLAAGMAQAEGLLDVDAPVSHYLPDVTLGDGVPAVTIRHLLQMTSGIDLPWTPSEMSDWPDLAREFLGRPSSGRTFHYSNASTYSAMRALETVVGDVHAWLVPRLFDPLDIRADWDRCPHGFIRAGGGLRLRVGELARIGRLIRDRGTWQRRQLVPSCWIDAMHSDWVQRDAGPGYTHYGLAAWRGPGEAWRLHGAHGQLVVFLHDSVVTVLADDHLRADAMSQRIAAELRG